jgi:hypothetical protein
MAFEQQALAPRRPLRSVVPEQSSVAAQLALPRVEHPWSASALVQFVLAQIAVLAPPWAMPLGFAALTTWPLARVLRTHPVPQVAQPSLGRGPWAEGQKPQHQCFSL